MIKAIAIDDEPLALKVIQNFCNHHNTVKLLHTFTNTEKAKVFLEKQPIDLLFLDIQMPQTSGIHFFNTLINPPQVIFTTAFSQYAITGFELNATDYLLKPFTKERFEQAIEKVLFIKKAQESSADDYIVVKVDYSLKKVLLNHIIFIEALDDYIKIHMEQGLPLLIRITLKAILEQLPQPKFIRVHRSYIVCRSKINYVRNKTINIGDREITIGRSYEKHFLEVFNSQY